MNAPNDPSFTGGIGGQVGGLGIAPGVPESAVDAAASANKSFQTTFSSGGAPCAGIQPGAPTCPLAVSLNTFPTGTLKTPYYYQYNLGLEQQIGSRGNLRADFVGTRGLHEPYQVQLNGYQNVCNGCFAPFPYAATARSAIWKCHRVPDRREQQLQRIADRLHAAVGRLDPARQLHLQSLPRRSIEWRLARFLHAGTGIAVAGRVKPAACQLRLRCAAEHLRVRGVSGSFPLRQSQSCARSLEVGRFRETAFLHSGLPFSVLSQQYSANGNGVLQASNPAQTIQFAVPNYANRVPGVPLYRKTPYPGVTINGTRQWLNPDAFVSVVDPTPAHVIPAFSAQQNDNPAICQFGNSGRNSVRGPHFTYSDMYITKTFPMREGIKLRIDGQLFNAFNHPNFALPGTVEAGVPGSVPARFGTLQSLTMPPTGLLGVGLGGDSSPRMIAFQGRIEF